MDTWYIKVFKDLDKSGVKFVVVGGVALNLHGIPRMTADMDLVVQLDPKNVLKFVSIIEKMGFKPKAPVPATQLADPAKRNDWLENKNMLVFSFVNHKLPYQILDVFISEPIPFKDLWKERVDVKLDNAIVPVISVDHLIKLKRVAGRLQDISDIEALKKLKKEIK